MRHRLVVRFRFAGSLFAGTLCLLCLSGCDATPRPGGSGLPAGLGSASFQGTAPIQAVATVAMVADVVSNVGGRHVAVTQIMGSGVDPHMYRVTRDDVRTILGADIVFYNGLMLEGKMADTLVKVGQRKPVIAVAEKMHASGLLPSTEFAEHRDPHVWMDVSAWSRSVDVVAETLAAFDPLHAADYLAAAALYRQELEELHLYAIRSIASIPEQSRVLITSHDAFNYFGQAYGIEVLGIQGLSTDSEAGLQRINALVDLLVSRDIRAVFVESSVPSKNIEALIEGALSRGHFVEVGGELFSDAMGQQGTYEGTYFGMLDHNITRVTQALGGEAPPRGLRGRLSTPAESSGPDRFETGRRKPQQIGATRQLHFVNGKRAGPVAHE